MLELCCDAACDFPIVDAFAEFSVRGAFSGGVDAVSVVDEDYHLCLILCLTVCGQSARDGQKYREPTIADSRMRRYDIFCYFCSEDAVRRL